MSKIDKHPEGYVQRCTCKYSNGRETLNLRLYLSQPLGSPAFTFVKCDSCKYSDQYVSCCGCGILLEPPIKKDCSKDQEKLCNECGPAIGRCDGCGQLIGHFGCYHCCGYADCEICS